jgi:hypothetical protein
MKEEKNPEYFHIFGYLLELIIKIWQFRKKKKKFKIWRICAIFFIKNPLHRLKSYFSGQSLAKFRPKKNDAIICLAFVLFVCCKLCVVVWFL